MLGVVPGGLTGKLTNKSLRVNAKCCLVRRDGGEIRPARREAGSIATISARALIIRDPTAGPSAYGAMSPQRGRRA